MPRGRKARVPKETTPQIMIAQPQDVDMIEVEIQSSPVHCSCQHCERTFSTTRGLKRHLSACKGDVSIASNDMGSHKKQKQMDPSMEKFMVPNKPMFTCAECRKKFRYEDSYSRHLKEVHSKRAGSVQCDRCPARCPNKRVLRKHMASHDAVKTRCPHCGQTFSRPYHLVRHFDQKGCNGEARKQFVCEVCHTGFSRKDNLMYHLRWHINKSNNEYQCPVCRKAFNKLQSLLRHNTKVHQGNIFECDLCGKTVNSRVAFVKHLLIHGEKNFACDQCNFKCKSAEILRRHSLRHSKHKPHQCLLCERSFIQAHELTAHTFRHTGHSSIVCARCGEAFPSRSTLKSHELRVHEGAPGLLCPHEACKGKRAFLNEISLRIHIKSHDINKPFKCPKCEKRFHIKAALSSHVLTHQWERARRCTHCPRARAYIRGDLLLRHLRIKHYEHYAESLKRVRRVLGIDPDSLSKITKEETSAMISMIDALQEEQMSDVPISIEAADRAGEDELEDEGSGGSPQDTKTRVLMDEFKPVMTLEELVENVQKMIVHLIDTESLKCLGWPESSIEEVLKRVLQQCGAPTAKAHKFTRAACLRENAKQLFLHVIEDDTITRMMNSRSIDEVIRHVVAASEQ